MRGKARLISWNGTELVGLPSFVVPELKVSFYGLPEVGKRFFLRIKDADTVRLLHSYTAGGVMWADMVVTHVSDCRYSDITFEGTFADNGGGCDTEGRAGVCVTPDIEDTTDAAIYQILRWAHRYEEGLEPEFVDSETYKLKVGLDVVERWLRGMSGLGIIQVLERQACQRYR
jgi:hypothetical protein